MDILRIIYTIAFVLFLPGAILTYIIFPRNKIDVIERTAMSFALSIMVVPLMVLMMTILGVPVNFISVTYQILFILSLVVIIILGKFLVIHVQKYVKN